MYCSLMQYFILRVLYLFHAVFCMVCSQSFFYSSISLFFCTIFVFYTFLSIFYCIIKERTFGLVSTFLHLPFLFSFPKVDSSYFHLNRLLKFLYFGLKFLFYLISFLLNFLIHTSLSWLHNQLITLLLTVNSQ